MTIVEIFSILVLTCNQVPDKCIEVVDKDVKNGTEEIHIFICDDRLNSNSDGLNIGVIDIDRPEERSILHFNFKCVDV